MSALEQLASTSPRTYLFQSPSGDSYLQYLHSLCVNQGITPPATDPVDCLHALFDVAIAAGMASIVLDYIIQVCSDIFLTSSDPVEAFLLDGECVNQWCISGLEASRARLTSWLSSPAAAVGSNNLAILATNPAPLYREITRLKAFCLITAALAGKSATATVLPSSSSISSSRKQAANNNDSNNIHNNDEDKVMSEATSLLQCAQVLEWLSSQKFEYNTSTGRFSSEQEWKWIASQRREAAAPLSLFLTSFFLPNLNETSTSSSTREEFYNGSGQSQQSFLSSSSSLLPASSIERLVYHLFLTNTTVASSFNSKVALIVYHLVDGAFLPAATLAEGLSGMMNIPPQLSFGWIALTMLDDAFLQYHQLAGKQTKNNNTDGTNEDGTNIQQQQQQQQYMHNFTQVLEIVEYFLIVADPETLPLEVPRALLAFNRPGSALSMLRKFKINSSMLNESQLAVDVYLANDLVHDAFLEIHRHALATTTIIEEEEDSGGGIDVLMSLLLDYATHRKILGTMTYLPVNYREEKAMMRWAHGGGEGGGRRKPKGEMVALYYLLRGRVPEGLLAYQSMCVKVGGERNEELEKLLNKAAAKDVPRVQLGLSVKEGGGKGIVRGGGGVVLASLVPEGGGRVRDVSGNGNGFLCVGEKVGDAPLISFVVEGRRRGTEDESAVKGSVAYSEPILFGK